MPKPFLPLLMLAALPLSIAAAPAPEYAVTRQIAGPDGPWDYASVDPETGALYVAHGDSVTVVDDLKAGVARSIGTIVHSHAAVPIPGGLLLVTSGRDDSVRLLDTHDGHELAKIAVGSDPDAAFYDPETGQAVVMNAKGGTVSMIDVAAKKVVRTITLKPALEFGVRGGGSTLFVNNEDANEIETADLRTGTAGATIAMPGCEGPTGLGYDARTEQLISACANGKAAVIDTKAGRMVALLDIGKGADAVIMDRARRLAFVPCGANGVLEIISLDAPGGAAIVGAVKTEKGARTGALDPRDGTLYLPTARFAPPAAPGARPAPLPGTFHILAVTRR
jgi:hypothetical protein